MPAPEEPPCRGFRWMGQSLMASLWTMTAVTDGWSPRSGGAKHGSPPPSSGRCWGPCGSQGHGSRSEPVVGEGEK